MPDNLPEPLPDSVLEKLEIGTGTAIDYEIEPPETPLLDELNWRQTSDGSWDDDIDTTSISIYSNALNRELMDITQQDAFQSSQAIRSAVNWTNSEDIANASTESQTMLAFSDVLSEEEASETLWNNYSPDANFDASPSFAYGLDDDLGIGDYAISAYEAAGSQIAVDESFTSRLKLLSDNVTNLPRIETTDLSQSIIALASIGEPVDDEINLLLESRNPNGSFGNVSETAWALMALSVAPGYYDEANLTLYWLRSQDISDNNSLALAALGELYYYQENPSSYIKEIKVESPFDIQLAGIIFITSAILSIIIFARLRDEDIMEGLRKDIYAFIEKNPGEHLASITKQFEISSSSARHHLYVLETSDMIVSYKAGKLKHFYVNKNGYNLHMNGTEYKSVISTLKNDTTRNIVKHLMENENTNQKAISEIMNLHPSTVNWHARRLKTAHIIQSARHGKDVRYSLNKELEIEKILRLIEGAAS